MVRALLAVLLLVPTAGALPVPEKYDKARLVTLPSGLQYEEQVPGTGATAKAGDDLYVHYVGTFLDGKQFDSSRTRQQPFQFKLGSGHVIKGWEEGIPGMNVGGKRRLVIPPGLAYGERGAGGLIPPNATLIFEIELIQIGK